MFNTTDRLKSSGNMENCHAVNAEHREAGREDCRPYLASDKNYGERNAVKSICNSPGLMGDALVMDAKRNTNYRMKETHMIEPR